MNSRFVIVEQFLLLHLFFLYLHDIFDNASMFHDFNVLLAGINTIQASV